MDWYRRSGLPCESGKKERRAESVDWACNPASSASQLVVAINIHKDFDYLVLDSGLNTLFQPLSCFPLGFSLHAVLYLSFVFFFSSLTSADTRSPVRTLFNFAFVNPTKKMQL